MLDWTEVTLTLHVHNFTHMLWESDCVNEALLPEDVSHFGNALGQLNSIGSKFRRLQFMVGNMGTSCNTLCVLYSSAGGDESTDNLLSLLCGFAVVTHNCWAVNLVTFLQRFHFNQRGGWRGIITFPLTGELWPLVRKAEQVPRNLRFVTLSLFMSSKLYSCRVFLSKVIKKLDDGKSWREGVRGQGLPALDISIVDSSCNQLCRSVSHLNGRHNWKCALLTTSEGIT